MYPFYIGVYIIHNSYLPIIGVHEMHGRMHPNYWQITILLVVDLCSSLAYFMMTQPLPIAGKLPIKTLVAKQLPTNSSTSIVSHYYINFVERKLAIVIVLFHTTMNGPFSYSRSRIIWQCPFNCMWIFS